MSRRTILLTTAGVVAALGIAAAIAVPAANEWLDNRHQETSSYATGAEAKKARVSVPRWLPDGAESVKYSMKTTGGERLLEAALPDGKPPAQCTPEPAGNAKEVQLQADWFPRDARSRATLRCGTYYGYLEGHTLYAWQHGEDLLNGERANAGS
ncbi:hypothetical protein [Streptomyces sp. NBC_00503]|uniref:hypothetical protein n=1 Tax=Streptomyces sp. NBC_00503 TaxID=2903659 RepID=UPI002E81A6CF|nr:hypothetical protein [Streptomyces sp. NBC_00503]WUD84553.1 hypothetical protein OG490_30555 [Streptomyces sp. NBC_00503]